MSVPFLSACTFPLSHSLLFLISHVVLELHLGNAMSVIILAWQVTGIPPELNPAPPKAVETKAHSYAVQPALSVSCSDFLGLLVGFIPQFSSI